MANARRLMKTIEGESIRPKSHHSVQSFNEERNLFEFVKLFFCPHDLFSMNPPDWGVNVL